VESKSLKVGVEFGHSPIKFFDGEIQFHPAIELGFVLGLGANSALSIGGASRHCLAVWPRRATLGRSVSLAVVKAENREKGTVRK